MNPIDFAARRAYKSTGIIDWKVLKINFIE